ncbi:MAG: hypothetical protein ACPGVZ_11425 [Myxococcota bacterium]
MHDSNILDQQITRAGFWAAVVGITAGIVQFILPLDVPGGFEATTAERVAWLSGNSGSFILGWANQIVLMVTLSGVWAALAWRAAATSPLAALLGGSLVALASMAFFINKFMAIWTIPMLAESISADSSASEMSALLLPILNVSIPFSLFTSIDYLGFWLYSLSGLLITLPLLRGTTASKVAGAMLGLFGVLYQGLIAGVLIGSITAKEVEGAVAIVALPLPLLMLAAVPVFRSSAKPEPEGE